MKLKQLIIPIAGALLLGGCEADHRDDNLLDSVVYLLNNNLQTANFYDVEETCDYTFRAFCSGYTVTPSNLEIGVSDDALAAYNEANGTAYTALDPACYRLVNTAGSVDADHPSAAFTVQLDCTGLKQLGDLTSYVIPLRLSSSASAVNKKLDVIFINPKMLETEVLAKNAGVVECDLGASSTLDFTAYVKFDNKWETTTEYVYGDEVLDAYNAAHGTKYLPIPAAAVSFTPAQLEAGKREAVSRFEIDKSQLTPDRFYTLAVQLKSNSKFQIGDDNTVLYHIALNPVFSDRNNWILVACSSWKTNAGPELITDGLPSTMYESRYNNSGEGDIKVLPVTIDWDLGKVCHYAGMTLTRRTGTYVTDLKAGWIELSDDGESWMPAQFFDFGGKSNTTVVGDFRSELVLGTGRYLRLKLTESNRTNLVSVCEFEPVLIDAGE